MNKKCPNCDTIKSLDDFKRTITGKISKFCLVCTYKRKKSNAKYYRKHKFYCDQLNKSNYKYADFKKKMKHKIKSYMIQDIKYGRLFDFDEYVDEIFLSIMLHIQKNKCYYCGKQLKTENYERYDKDQASVDRLDSSKPHLKSNISISCLDCNLKKRQMSEDDFFKKINN